MSTVSLLVILDGFGHSLKLSTTQLRWPRRQHGTALSHSVPYADIRFGLDVGLPQGQMGNPRWPYEPWFGRVVYQDFTRINRAINTKEFE